MVFVLQMVLDLNQPADDDYYDAEPNFCTQVPVLETVDESPDPVGRRHKGLDDEGSGRGQNTMQPLNRLTLAYQLLLLSQQHLLQTLVCQRPKKVMKVMEWQPMKKLLPVHLSLFWV